MRRELILSVVLVMGLGACGEVSEDFVPAPGQADSNAPAMTEAAADQEAAPAPSTTNAEVEGDDEPVQSTSSSIEVQPIPGEDDVTPSTNPPADPSIDPSLAPFVEQAKADLASRLGVGVTEISVISAELVEWSDASLGCPQPGMVYAQVPTDGSLIRLSYGGVQYDYHTGGSQYVPFLCENK